MQNQISYNCNQVNALTKSEIADILIVGFSSGDFDPLVILPDPSPRVQIAQLFEYLENGNKRKLRAATTDAISSIPGRFMPLSMATELIFLAIDIDNAEVIPLLRDRLQQILRNPLAGPELVAEASAMVAVIGGFAPHPEAIQALRDLYLEPGCSYKYAAQIMNALSRSDVANFCEYLNWFSFVYLDHSGDFDLDGIFSQLLEFIGPVRLLNNIRYVHPFMRKKLEAFLLGEAGGQIRVRLDPFTLAMGIAAGPEQSISVPLEDSSYEGQRLQYQLSKRQYLPTGSVQFDILSLLPKEVSDDRGRSSVSANGLQSGPAGI